MPTIELSDGFMTTGFGASSQYQTGFRNRVFYIAFINSIGDSRDQMGLNMQSTFQRARIMKGVVPTDFSALTLYSSRNSDTLIEWAGSSSPGIITTTGPGNTMTISTSYKPSTQTATATWFWFLNYVPYGSGVLEIVQQFIGTIGVTGSGADLEVPSTSFVTGLNYRILNLKISTPSSWTY